VQQNNNLIISITTATVTRRSLAGNQSHSVYKQIINKSSSIMHTFIRSLTYQLLQ